ncbi:MAG: hypothetical protein DRG20_03950 [Deltaproteobacteria bacterium]|nr:MAG: hypothetical protein DRG20_03950 [Deltaproteobacteria bacterium]
MSIAGKTLFELAVDWTMIPLEFIFIYMVYLVIERLLYWSKIKLDYHKFIENFKKQIQSGGVEAGIRFLREFNMDHMVISVLKVGLDNWRKKPEEVEALMESQVFVERDKLRKRTGALSTVAAIGPLLGLFGTVIGLIRAFNNIYITGEGGPKVVGAGIAVALLTTAVGLVIAVPSVIVYNIISNKINDMTEQAKAAINEFIVLLEHQKETSRKVMI